MFDTKVLQNEATEGKNHFVFAPSLRLIAIISPENHNNTLENIED